MIGSDHCYLNAVNRWERVEQTVPFFAAVVAHPELARGGAEVKRGRF